MNDPPQISAIPSQELFEDTASAPIAFAVMDVETPASNLVVSAFSCNPALIGLSQIVLSGTDTNRTISLQPLPNQFGIADITLQVRDAEGAVAQSTFRVMVNPVNDPPQISQTPDAFLLRSRTSDPIPFTISDIESPPASLDVTVSSSNPDIVPLSGLVLNGTDNNRTLVIAPTDRRIGVSIITITVNDGSSTASVSFQVTVAHSY